MQKRKNYNSAGIGNDNNIMAIKYETILLFLMCLIQLAWDGYLMYWLSSDIYDWNTIIELLVITATPIIISYYKWADRKLMLFVIIYSFVAAVLVLIQDEKREAKEHSIYDQLNDLYGDYQANEDKISEFQEQLECCGMFSYKDYIARNIRLPPTCCPFPDKIDKFECIEEYTHKDGCFEKFELRQTKLRIWKFGLILAAFVLPLFVTVIKTIWTAAFTCYQPTPISQNKAENCDIERDSEASISAPILGRQEV